MATRKNIFDGLDRLEGKKEGSSHAALNKERVRQGYKPEGAKHKALIAHTAKIAGKDKAAREKSMVSETHRILKHKALKAKTGTSIKGLSMKEARRNDNAFRKGKPIPPEK